MTLLPLGYSLLHEESDLDARIEHTIRQHPEVANRFDRGEEFTADKLFEALPERRIDGALLPRDTCLHWGFAGLATLLFLGLIAALFDIGMAKSPQLVVVGIVTATVGIFSLLAFQWLGDLAMHVNLRGGNIVILAVFYFVKLIGFSYRAALDPANGIALSFFGFTIGVGFCEELTKVMPVIVACRDDERGIDWRGALAWGLASGVGFGIAEGIHYSAEYYNGFHGPMAYLVRFVSCVGLHAIWSASVALMIYHNQSSFEGELTWYEWLLAILKVQWVAMILHGLYDTLLKRDMNLGAMAIAVGSFIYLAWMIHITADDSEPEYATA